MYECSSTCPHPQRGSPQQLAGSPDAAATGDWGRGSMSRETAATNYSRDRREGRGHKSRWRLRLGRYQEGGQGEGPREREGRGEGGAMESNKPGAQRFNKIVNNIKIGARKSMQTATLRFMAVENFKSKIISTIP